MSDCESNDNEERNKPDEKTKKIKIHEEEGDDNVEGMTDFLYFSPSHSASQEGIYALYFFFTLFLPLSSITFM